MNIKKYFTGKTGCLFWFNVILIFLLFASALVVLYFSLDTYTHHGEKIEVPSLVGQDKTQAMQILKNKGLNPVITDSMFRQDYRPGVILTQTPTSGSIVKSSHTISLSVNMSHEPLLRMPDLAGNSSYNKAESILKAMGFHFTDPVFVAGQPKDLVIKILQGRHKVHTGEMIGKRRALTLYIGAGEDDLLTDSLPSNYIPSDDEIYDDEDYVDDIPAEPVFDIVQ